MKLINYTQLLKEYNGFYDLSKNELPQRENVLNQKPFSVILEGEHNEFDSLDAWIRSNIHDKELEFIYYGKTDYDYGCAEYFSSKESDINKLKKVIPNIYTLYPDAKPSIQISKTDGSGKWIEYNLKDKYGIIINLNE